MPDALRRTGSWVAWSYALRDGRWTKPPKRATGGGMAKTTDPATWSTFEAAAAVAPAHDGIGLVLVEDLVGIDLDHVLDPETGEIEAWASEVLQRFAGCYVERSPSGDGIRIFCRGAARRCGKGGPSNRLEVYDKTSPRYLTYTGHRLGEGEVVEAQAALDWLHDTFMQKAAPKAEKAPTGASGGLTDKEVLRRAREARNGNKFARLWSGDAGEDQSSADAALIGILSFWTQNRAQLDRLFRRSMLMRAKWDEPRGETTYGWHTIDKVLAMGGERYSPVSRVSPGSGDARTSDGAWPELDPLPEVTDRAPAPFPFDGLGSTMGAAARDIADAVQAPDAMAAGSVLAAASLAVQPHYNVMLPHGMPVPLSLYVLTSATSGDRKTGTDAVACKTINEQREADYRRYSAAKLHYEQEIAERKRGDPAPVEPVQTSIVVSKSTIEGVLRLLANQPHVGVFSNEGAEIFGGHSMREDKRSSGVAFLCKAWDGAVLDNVTGGDGVRVLIGRRVCMHAMLQPVVLRPLLADAIADGQGLLARCLIAQPESLAGTRLFPENMVPAFERPAVVAYLRRIKTLVEKAMPQASGAAPHQLTPANLQMTNDARALWVEFYNEVERRQATGGELESVRPWASKAAEHAARIAGVVAVVEGHTEVTEADMDCGMRAADFFLGEHVRLMGASVEDRHLRRLTTLFDWLRGHGKPVRHADVLQKAPRFIREQKAAGINALLDELRRRGYIRRRADLWEVNPDA